VLPTVVGLPLIERRVSRITREETAGAERRT
jgi:hypothetical protein